MMNKGKYKFCWRIRNLLFYISLKKCFTLFAVQESSFSNVKQVIGYMPQDGENGEAQIYGWISYTGYYKGIGDSRVVWQ
jgi:hypothetical protein